MTMLGFRVQGLGFSMLPEMSMSIDKDVKLES